MANSENKTGIVFTGLDVSLETSLFEYGIICRYNQKDKDYFCIYTVDEKNCDTGYISHKYVNELVGGNEWMNREDCIMFLNSVGSSLELWIKFPIVCKLQDLISYWGYENIMGTCYHPFTNEDILKTYPEILD